jgi:hypothetical protein
MKISDSIQAYLTAKNLREQSFKERKFYVSDMGKCQRTRFLKRKGFSTELTPFVYWIFEMGNMIHDFGYKALEAQGLLLSTEESVGTDHFSGRYDGTVNNSEGKPAIFDFKSSGGYAFKKAMAGADNEENISQILTYVLIKRKIDKKLSDSGILVYINKEPKDDIPKIAHDMEYHLTSMREKSLQKEMDTMVEFWLTDKIPPCTCPSWMKAYNSFLPFCSMEEKDIKKYLLMLKGEGKRIISTKNSIIAIGIDKDGKDKREEVFHL